MYDILAAIRHALKIVLSVQCGAFSCERNAYSVDTLDVIPHYAYRF